SQITHRNFFKVAGEVEKLVVMCLLELTKLQMSGLGYKMRTQITKALKSRAVAVHHALEQYNKLADKMQPLRSHLSWDNIVDSSFLAEFSLLCETNPNILSKRWADPARRVLAVQHFEMCRAKEEIVRCNIEILHLLTKIHDDQVDMLQAIKTVKATNPALAAEMEKWWRYLRRVN
ncbi:hypothetical protein CONPUDRAFT_32134, partial [Coniophora puteana RWD-64-598 SS2]